MQVGDVIMAVPVALTLNVKEKEQEYQPIPGTVVFIHPKRRFYVLEFSFGAYKIRESFFFHVKKVGSNYENNSDHERQGRRRKNNHNCKYGERTR